MFYEYMQKIIKKRQSFFQEYNTTLDIKVEDTIKEILSLLNNVDKEEVNIKVQDETATMLLENIVPLPHSSLKVAFNIELQKDAQKKVSIIILFAIGLGNYNQRLVDTVFCLNFSILESEFSDSCPSEHIFSWALKVDIYMFPIRFDF